MKLKNKIALITGASRGIGREIALAFAQEGAHLFITGRASDLLESLQTEVAQTGVTCHWLAGDLSQKDATAPIWEQCQKMFDGVDILVNNAGIGSSASPKPIIDYNDEFWERSLHVNLTVPYLLSKAVLPGMVAQHYGRIINIASINSRIPSIHGAAYAASKHGLLGFTRALALEVTQAGITVNAICPGATRTLINDKRIQYDSERLNMAFEEVESQTTLLGRRLEAKEIAPLAVFLASDEAAVISGQGYNIDGGRVMS